MKQMVFEQIDIVNSKPLGESKVEEKRDDSIRSDSVESARPATKPNHPVLDEVYRCYNPDQHFRILAAAIGAAWYVCCAWFGTDGLDSVFDQAALALAWTGCYWIVGAAVKFADDIIDDEDDKPLIAAINNPAIVSPWARFAILAGLTAVASTFAFAAAMSPVATVMMLGEVLGCTLGGKVDAWEHLAVLFAILGAATVQCAESGLAGPFGATLGVEGHSASWGALELAGCTALCIAGGLADELLRAVVKSARLARWRRSLQEAREQGRQDLAPEDHRWLWDPESEITWGEFWEETVTGRYLAWLVAMTVVVGWKGHWGHAFVMAAFGYEDIVHLYPSIRVALCGSGPLLPAVGTLDTLERRVGAGSVE